MRLEAAMTPEQRALYAQLEQQGIVPSLQQSVAQSTLESLPTQASTIAARKAELAALQQAAPQAAASRTAELLKPQARNDLWTLFRQYGEGPLGAAIGAYVGNEVFDSPVAGAGFGMLGGLYTGRTRMGKAIHTRLTRPAHQKAIGEALVKAGIPPTTPLGQALLRAVGSGSAAGLTPALVGEETP
jgi:hypothetical protein